MRIEQSINYQWLFAKQYKEEYTARHCDESQFESVMIPHANQEVPYHYFDEGMYQNVSCYRKHFKAQKEWVGKQIFLQFGAVASYAVVYVNGQWIGEHKGGYTAFSFDITKYIDWSDDNVITVVVDANEREEIPPFGKVIDYLTYGGMYREVSILVVNEYHIDDVFVRTLDIEKENKRLQVDVTLSQAHPDGEVFYELFDQNGSIIYTSSPLKTSKTSMTLEDTIAGVMLWDIENPNLYTIKVTYRNDREVLDQTPTRFGFRSCVFKEDGFYLNGKHMKLMGLNRHQAYPYVGYAMPRSAQEEDARTLKYKLGLNLVRTSHYPQSKHFINMCDEIGLLVFTEIPGWQHIGEKGEWWDITCQHAREMVMQYRNHPSIIIWGVRVNESPDCDELYQMTNDIVHALDNTRQTGGVRCIKNSNLLEDVYTYNDFIHRGFNEALDDVQSVMGEGVHAPYMVTEYNGHMYPTKRFDHEERRLEHAHRHLRVLHAMHKDPKISGSIGWCFADYNTHKDFGSGDRICYHGVLDMFRQPKLAAYAYASQGLDPDKQVVMEVSSTMDIGEHDACEIKDVIVFTNLDRIDLYKNDNFIQSFYPNTKAYPHLPHPPVVIDDMIGDMLAKHEPYSAVVAAKIKELALAISKYGQNTLPQEYEDKMAAIKQEHGISRDEVQAMYSKYVGNWGGVVTTYRFEGIRNNEVVKTIVKAPVMSLDTNITVDRYHLVETTTYDMTRVVVDAVDQNGNLLPFYHEPVQIQVEGELALVGPEWISFIGGSCGFYVKSIGKSGDGKVTISSARLGRKTISFVVSANE